MDQQPKILIVEDDAFLREVYIETLEKEGFSIASAEDGEQGLEKLRPGGWDLVLLDIIMPKLNGLEVMKKFKEDPNAKPSKCIIFLTNLDKDEEIKEALLLGDGYLIKSQMTPGDFLKEVKGFLVKNQNQPQTPPATTPPAAA